MAWIYLAESEDSQKPWMAMCDQSPTVKTTDTHKESSYLEWQKATYPWLQYGTTYGLSTDGFYAAPTFYTADSPAKTLALPAAEKAWEESVADYFLRSQGCVAKYDLDSCSWRTSQLSLFEERSELLGSFAASGMTVDGEFYPLRTWARIIDGSDGGFWPTPAYNPSRGLRSGEPGDKNRVRLEPAGGSLNPTWVEWLMGYPSEWTVLEPWAMQWFRPKRGKRSSV